jgi:hypothetical protein
LVPGAWILEFPPPGGALASELLQKFETVRGSQRFTRELRGTGGGTRFAADKLNLFQK